MACPHHHHQPKSWTNATTTTTPILGTRFISSHRTIPILNNINVERINLVMAAGQCSSGGEVAEKGGFRGVLEEGGRDGGRFVDVLRETQPYLNLYRGTTFVVFISSEIVSAPLLDSIIKVSHL
ncbi:hypothetical protein ACFE04_000450 [Oxalis oulophora]